MMFGGRDVNTLDLPVENVAECLARGQCTICMLDFDKPLFCSHCKWDARPLAVSLGVEGAVEK